MGADIHMYPEYRAKEPVRPDWNPWWGFGGRINPGRDYWLFALLADVRGQGAVIEPRGMPDDAGWIAADDNRLFISEDEGEGCVTMEQAQRWVSGGYGVHFVNDRDGKPTWVTHPDWHSHSWLTADELEAVFATYRKKHRAEVGLEYRALLAALRTLEADGKNDTRVVFWFDN